MATVQADRTGEEASGAPVLVSEEICVRPRSEGVRRVKRRAQRHGRLSLLKPRTTLRSVSGCGLPIAGTVHVGVVDQGDDLVAHVSGIGRCASPWACPVCAPVVREGRAREIDEGVRVALDRGWSVLFVTTTLPHSWGDRLARTFDLVREGHRRTRSGRAWQRLRDSLGYQGGIRAWEVTHGHHGWHPHAHELLVFSRQLSDVELDQVAEHYRRTYGQFIERKAGRLHPVHGIDVRRVATADDLGGYLTKVEGGWGAGLEVARADLKRAAGGMTPWDILGEAVDQGDCAAWALWWEYEQATQGKRAITWSPGLRGRLLGSDEEPTDDELAAEEAEAPEVWGVDVPGEEWAAMLRAGVIAHFLEECERRAAVERRPGAPPPGGRGVGRPSTMG